MTASGAPAHPRLRPPTYRTLVLIGVVVLLAVLALAAGAALTPYILTLILAFVLNPAVDWLEKRGLRRGLGTVLIIVGIVAAVGAVAYLVGDRLIDQASALIASWPEASATLITDLEALGLPPGLIDPLVSLIDALPDLIVNLGPDLLRTAVAAIGSGIVALVTLVGLPFFLYYVLVDRSTLVRGAYSLIPEEYVDSVRDISAIANGVFGAWAWSQLLLSLSVSVPVFIGFLLLGFMIDPFYTSFALLFAVICLLRRVHPDRGRLPGDDPSRDHHPGRRGTTWRRAHCPPLHRGPVLRGKRPRAAHPGPCPQPATGRRTGALVIGVALGGFLGVLIALPVTATLREVVAYLYDRAAATPSVPVGPNAS